MLRHHPVFNPEPRQVFRSIDELKRALASREAAREAAKTINPSGNSARAPESTR